MTTPKPKARQRYPKAGAKQKRPAERPLTPKQEAFYREYLNTGNASEAYRRAYNASRMKPRTIEQRAHELLKHSEIAARLAEQATEARRRAEDRYQVSKERVIAELSRIAFARSSDFFTWGPDGVTLKESSELSDAQIAAVGEVSERPGQFGNTIRVKLHDKVAALEKLGRHVGAFKPEEEEAAETVFGRMLKELAGATASLL